MHSFFLVFNDIYYNYEDYTLKTKKRKVFMQLNDYLDRRGNYGYLRVKVVVNSRSNEIIEILEGDIVKIRLKAAPEKGKANKLLLAFVADQLGVKQNQIAISSGKTDKNKCLRVDLS